MMEIIIVPFRLSIDNDLLSPLINCSHCSAKTQLLSYKMEDTQYVDPRYVLQEN